MPWFAKTSNFVVAIAVNMIIINGIAVNLVNNPKRISGPQITSKVPTKYPKIQDWAIRFFQTALHHGWQGKETDLNQQHPPSGVH